jgi:hypothetical protein
MKSDIEKQLRMFPDDIKLTRKLAKEWIKNHSK